MKKRIGLGILILIIALAGFWSYKKREATSLTHPQADYSQSAGSVTTLTTGVESNPIALSAWQIFQEYLAAAKAHNIAALVPLSYKLSPICASVSTRSDCYAVMDRVVKAGSTFKEGDFKNVSYDNRQIIISTDWHLEENEVQIGYGREVIYFVRDASGNAHVLFFTQPEEVVYSFIDPKETHAALVARLKERIVDSDGDYLEDEYETCSYQGAASSTPPCVQTDPHKMDTNGNGWWDSIEQYLK